MAPETVVALCSLVGTLVGSIGGVVVSNRLTTYRIEQLEKKMDKHNQVVERMALVEQDNRAQWRRIDEHTVKIEKLEEAV